MAENGFGSLAADASVWFRRDNYYWKRNVSKLAENMQKNEIMVVIREALELAIRIAIFTDSMTVTGNKKDYLGNEMNEITVRNDGEVHSTSSCVLGSEIEISFTQHEDLDFIKNEIYEVNGFRGNWNSFRRCFSNSSSEVRRINRLWVYRRFFKWRKSPRLCA